MEEQIKTIENMIFDIEMNNSDYKYCDDNECWLSENQVKAIKSIIAGYKEQKCKADIQDATINNMKDFIAQLERKIEIKDAYLDLLDDVACDYDGCNTVESLKKLIDELVTYADKAYKCEANVREFIGGDGKEYNILHEELGGNDDKRRL